MVLMKTEMGIDMKVGFRLRHLKCLLSSEYEGDEVYIRYNNRKIWPKDEMWYRVSQGEEVLMDVKQPVASVGDKVELELWECDIVSHSKLGNFIFSIDSSRGTYTVDLASKNGKAKYSLVWEAIL
jgi:hypothetical protein